MRFTSFRGDMKKIGKTKGVFGAVYDAPKRASRCVELHANVVSGDIENL